MIGVLIEFHPETCLSSVNRILVKETRTARPDGSTHGTDDNDVSWQLEPPEVCAPNLMCERGKGDCVKCLLDASAVCVQICSNSAILLCKLRNPCWLI